MDGQECASVIENDEDGQFCSYRKRSLPIGNAVFGFFFVTVVIFQVLGTARLGIYVRAARLKKDVMESGNQKLRDGLSFYVSKISYLLYLIFLIFYLAYFGGTIKLINGNNMNVTLRVIGPLFYFCVLVFIFLNQLLYFYWIREFDMRVQTSIYIQN